MNQTDRHTPGPFKAQQGSEFEPERWTIVADNGTKPFLIATIENGQPGDTVETEKYTAHLFASAPELLEAAEEGLAVGKALMNIMNGMDVPEFVRAELWLEQAGVKKGFGKRIGAALSRARGEGGEL